MKRLVISHLILSLAICLSWSQSSQFHGVIVGSNTAPGETDLHYAVSDAIAFRDALVYNLGWSLANFTVKVNQSAVKAQIIDAVGAMPKNTETDLFYYAGHGDPYGLECYDGNYIAPADLQGEFGTSYSKFAVYIDACASGIFPDYMQQTGVICSASRSDEPALEDTVSLHAGVFGYYLTQGLTNRAAGGTDGIVTARELYDYAQLRTTTNLQHTQLSDNYSGSLVLDPIPSVPQGLSISGATGQHPTVSWTANSDGDLVGYKVYRKITPDESQFSLVATTSQTSWTDPYVTVRTGGTDGQYVYYYVKAYDGAGQLSDASSTVYKPVNYNPPKANRGNGQALTLEPTPTDFALLQNYPNPFNPTTEIRYQLPSEADVSLKIYDIVGNEVASLVEGRTGVGYHRVTFDGSMLSSGTYLARFVARPLNGDKPTIQTTKVVLMK